MSAPASTGSTTAPAAAPATVETAAPSTAATPTVPVSNTRYKPASKTQKDFAPRQNVLPQSGRTNPGLSMLLSGVSDLPFNGIKRNETTYIVPNLTQFYYVLSLMDTQMVHTKRFTDANSDWHPFVSQLYFGILIYYQVLKCQKIGGFISHEQTLFLEYLDSQFKAEHLKIPGPLVIFFQSLAACSGPNENFGNIVFAIPNNLGVSQSSFYSAVNRLNFNLPNMLFILDQFMRMLNDIGPVGAVPGPVTQASTDRIYMSIFNLPANAAARNKVCMLTPSARNEVQTTTSLLSGLVSSSNIWRSTLPFDPATNNSQYIDGDNQTILDLSQTLGFRGIGDNANTNYGWFSQVARIMQPYGDFFKDTVSLGSVTTTGIGINYISTAYTNTDDNALALTHDVLTRDVRYQLPGTVRYVIPNYENIQTVHQHSEEYLDAVTEQAGVLTQLFTSWSLINQNVFSRYSGPFDNNTAVGPLTIRLPSRRTGNITVSNTIPPIVSGYYHTPSALKFE